MPLQPGSEDPDVQSSYFFPMLTTQQMLLLVFLFIVCICVWVQSPDNAVYNSQAYVINMDHHKDRLSTIHAKYNASDLRPELGALQRVKAVDGTMVDWTRVVHGHSIESLKRVATTGKRRAHEELTPGAVGCYLSHLAVWTLFLESRRSYALIFEDDADIMPSTMSQLKKCVDEMQEDWDMLLLGWEGESVPHGPHTRKVTSFVRLHGYVISERCARRLLPAMLPMKVQVDWAITSLIPTLDLKVFGASPHVTDITYQGTSIQTPFESEVNGDPPSSSG